MGKRGPKRTPTRVLQGRGSWRAKSRGPEPTVPEGIPDMPIGLRADAVGIWKDVTAQIEEMGLLGRCDGQSIARYCQAVVKYWECEGILEQLGLTYVVESYLSPSEKPEKSKAKKGTKAKPPKDRILVTRERPEVKLAARLAEECRRFENAFGLNPSARTGLCQQKPADSRENRGKRKNIGRFFTIAAG